MRPLYVTPLARQDLIDLWAWIAVENEAAADLILDRIAAALDRLTAFPERGRKRPDLAPEARSLVIDRWLVLYRLDETQITIVRVVDGRRDLTTIAF